MISKSLRRIAITAACATLLWAALDRNVAHAGFIGGYGPSNFTFMDDGTGGSVDTSNAPNSITITGGDDFVEGLTSFTTIAAGSGTVSFDWLYETFDDDGPTYDPFVWIYNDTFTQLSLDDGGSSQSGSELFDVTLGDEFGWGIYTVDGEFGPAQVTISEFNAPTPEPGTMLLMSSGLASMLGYGWRKRKQQNI